MKLTFYGGARTVTGANYLLEEGGPSTSSGTKILIDCGLEQGKGFCELGNWDRFGFDPATIAAVLVTHSHIDHIGRLPKLMREGFKGRVYSTPPTKDFSRLMLSDSDHILEQESDRCGKPIIFDQKDIDNLMNHWETRDYHEQFNIGPLKIIFYNAGHILGSSFIVVEAEGKKITFSGDLGNSPAPIIGNKEPLEKCDYLLIESTYGDRIHEDAPKRKEILKELITDTVKRRGTLLIPAFALERTQDILYEIDSLADSGLIPKVPVFLDSPLAINLTEIYRRHEKYFVPEAREHLKNQGHIFRFKGLKMTQTTEESKAINNVAPPKVIIAGSGMMHGGRILHHAKRYLPDPKSTLLIVGYQANGSLGRAILNKAASVRIHGEDVAVNCRVKAIGGYSAHADQAQLMDWVRPMAGSIKRVFAVQGEDKPAEALAEKIKRELGVEAVVPQKGQEVIL